MPDTIPLRYAQSLLRLAVAPRAQLQAELAELKLPAVLLEERARPDARIGLDDYGRLFVHLLMQLQEHLPGQAINAEDVRSFSAFRMMFVAMLHSRNLGQALQRASMYFRRLSTGDYFEVSEEGDQAHCRFEFAAAEDRPLTAPENFTIDELHWLPGLTGRVLSMAMWHRLCSWFIGSYIELDAVTMPPPSPGKDYREVFGVPVAYDSGVYQLMFPARFLAFPVVQDEHALEAMLATYPAELFRLGPEEHRITERVRGLIGSDFRRALPSLQDVADRLGTTTPTLHRRLREEGTSFQQLKDDCRRDAAITLLTGGDFTGAEMSERLGFSEASTFNRAFKKWTGMTPSEYRRHHLASR